jgi:hypothetical protein
MSSVRDLTGTGEVHRPLVTRAGFFGLGASVIVVLCLLLPTAMRRQTLALEILPDALSLIYLDLNLARQPLDVQLRFQIAKKRLEAGQFDAARATLLPLLNPGTLVFARAADLNLLSEAEQLRLEIDHKAWAAIEPRAVDARAQAMARVVADIGAVDLSDASAERVLKMAELCQSLAQPARAAELLDRLARRVLPEFEAHVAAAETAHLQADQGVRAVELQVFASDRAAGAARLAHALRALELARGVMDGPSVLALAEKLRLRFGADDPQLMAASLDLAQAVDVKLAFGLAQKLLKNRPNDVTLHRRLARLAEWNGYGLRALDEYVWLVRRENKPEDRARAIELAKANWDLRLLRELLAGANADRPDAESETADANPAPRAKNRNARSAAERRERTPRRLRRNGQLSMSFTHRRARVCGGGERQELANRASDDRVARTTITVDASDEPVRSTVTSTAPAQSDVTVYSTSASESRSDSLAASPRDQSVQHPVLSRDGGTSAQSDAVPAVPTDARRLERRRAQLRENLSLLEALGDTRAALAAVDTALRGELSSDVVTWHLKVELLRRAGRADAAAEALDGIAQRFPSLARALELADARLGLGQRTEALHALVNAPEPYSEAYLRQVLEVAWELGDLATSERIAGRLVTLPNASAWDVARLYQLQRSNPDLNVPLATALSGFERFKNAEMLRLVIESTQRSNDDAKVAGLLGEAERFGGFRSDPGYWQQRITLHQRMAFAAFEQREYVAAKRELGEAEKALTLAPENAPSANAVYELLWTSQHAQALAVALEANDTSSLAQVFSRYGRELPIRQQVYVLHRLDRHDEAFALAKRGAADPTLSDDDRTALRADHPSDATAQAADRPSYARASSEFFDSDGLRLWTNQAELEIDGTSLGLHAGASISDITPQKALRALQPSAAREVAPELGGRIASSELSGGFRVRDGGNLRPFGAFRQGILGDRGNILSASASINALSFDSSQLRLLGATDEVALQASIPFGLGYYASARAAGNRYVTLERDYLGAGVSLDGGVGRSFQLPDDFARAAVRVAGRYAPRFRDPSDAARADIRKPANWIAETMGFTGLGASLARGELEVPNASDPTFRFLLDGTVGVLWPTQKLGWSGQVGVGTGLFGSDQLSASLQTGNVVGSVAYWSVQAGYAVGLD